MMIETLIYLQKNTRFLNDSNIILLIINILIYLTKQTITSTDKYIYLNNIIFILEKRSIYILSIFILHILSDRF